ncbi:hypothetical protein ElyMa_000327300 [Elysia marginata]|uniref:Uncharacterized protein n=1 Tax=Elysia marginata TaxID=1093978 RepID=A0AAV4FAZ5_9GAST|nr:hypothetical protein ElyMa_000327300 [Elysia marginata]
MASGLYRKFMIGLIVCLLMTSCLARPCENGMTQCSGIINDVCDILLVMTSAEIFSCSTTQNLMCVPLVFGIMVFGCVKTVIFG